MGYCQQSKSHEEEKDTVMETQNVINAAGKDLKDGAKEVVGEVSSDSGNSSRGSSIKDNVSTDGISDSLAEKLQIAVCEIESKSDESKADVVSCKDFKFLKPLGKGGGICSYLVCCRLNY